MAFVQYTKSKHTIGRQIEIMPGTCSFTKIGKTGFRVVLSQHESNRGFSKVTKVSVWFDKATNNLGIQESESNDTSASVMSGGRGKHDRKYFSLPRDLCDDLHAAGIKYGRYYIEYVQRLGMWVITAGQPIPQAPKASNISV